jgi:hypothetical protein
MKSLIGNGQPGRISMLEKKVARHDRYFYWGTGCVVALGTVGKFLLAKFGIKL